MRTVSDHEILGRFAQKNNCEYCNIRSDKNVND